MKPKAVILGVLFSLLFGCVAAQGIDGKVKSLLSRMTLEEKVAQLRSIYVASPKMDAAFLNDPARMDSLLGKGIGMVNPDFDNSVEESARLRNAVAAYLRAKTRLGIPAIFLDEAHHGLLAQKVDVFPTSISLACSWDTALTERIYGYVAKQASVRGTNMVLAPVVDVCRDPRWGRTSETFGEDPFLCGMMGSAVVRGFQGSSDGHIGLGHVAATLKHFTGHGQPEGGDNTAPGDFPDRVLRTFHIGPFRLTIAGAKPAAVMAAYVEIDGIPCHANSWLLKDVLRGEWGYQGLVVSDWFAIDQLWQKHLVAANQTDAALQAFNAGVTVDLPFGVNYRHLVELAEAGKVRMAALDSAVSDVLRLKYKLGLFDRRDSIDVKAALAETGKPEGRALALKAAEESMVLLKNSNQILPLNKAKYKNIALIGPCAAINYTGDYSGIPLHSVSLLEGLRHKGLQVTYAKGTSITTNGDSLSFNNFEKIDQPKFAAADQNDKELAEAVKVAKAADVIILAIGENEQLVREAWPPNHFGDSDNLDLPANEERLFEALIETGKPIIVYLAHGRPLCINTIADKADAILDGWFSGEESGNAAANILFGDVNPSGKLTFSVPRSTGQIPVYYNHKPSAQYFNYVSDSHTPLYSFGYGLSYTTYAYSKPSLSGNVVSVQIANTGSIAGDEIVQLYVHPKVAEVTQPVKALKGFQRISLAPGETKTVSFTITKDQLAYWDKSMHFNAPPGVYELMIGTSSDQVQKINYTINN